MINGKRYAWEDVVINLPSGVAIDIQSISYKDARATRRVFGKGARARGYSQGNYTASGTAVLRREEYERLAARAGGQGIYGMKPFTITVSYANDEEPTITDVLQSVKWTERESGAEQDAEGINVTINFEVLDDIKWGNKASFIDKP
jgi:hypothetical protein